MPITQLDLPILAHFLCAVASTTGEFPPVMNASQSSNRPAVADDGGNADPAPLPKGMVLGPDSKPCRSCTKAATWKTMMSRAAQSPSASSSSSFSSSSFSSSTALSQSSKPQQQSQSDGDNNDCPADVELLGRSTWTLLHSIAAQYPERATAAQQTETRQFLGLFGKLYPCWACAADFRAWSAEHAPRVSSRDEFGRWMCEAHNAVNEKLGKQTFDCGRWEERWRTGWKDGRCD